MAGPFAALLVGRWLLLVGVLGWLLALALVNAGELDSATSEIIAAADLASVPPGRGPGARRDRRRGHLAGGGVLLVKLDLGDQLDAIAAADLSSTVLLAAGRARRPSTRPRTSSSARSPPPPSSPVVAYSWSSSSSVTNSARSPPPTSPAPCSSPRSSSPAVDQAEDLELGATAAADLAGSGVLLVELELGAIAAATDLAGAEVELAGARRPARRDRPRRRRAPRRGRTRQPSTRPRTSSSARSPRSSSPAVDQAEDLELGAIAAAAADLAGGGVLLVELELGDQLGAIAAAAVELAAAD